MRTFLMIFKVAIQRFFLFLHCVQRAVEFGAKLLNVFNSAHHAGSTSNTHRSGQTNNLASVQMKNMHVTFVSNN